MKGLIYKDVSLFFKYVDKKLIILLAGVIALIMYAVREYAGVLTSMNQCEECPSKEVCKHPPGILWCET